MAIPPKLHELIAQAKQQMPQLAHLPDEVVAQVILQAMQEHLAGSPLSEKDLKKMSAYDLTTRGEQLLDLGRSQEAEKYVLQSRTRREKNTKAQLDALTILGRLFYERSGFPEAMVLCRQGLVLAERIGDRRLMGVIYDGLDTTYRMQGDYQQAI